MRRTFHLVAAATFIVALTSLPLGAEPFQPDSLSQQQADSEIKPLAENTPISLVPALAEFKKAAQRIEYPSGHLKLPGLLYKPSGNGPFPAVIWNHGSEKTPGPQVELARFYTERGFVFFLPTREGHGNAPGDYIVDLQKQILARGISPKSLTEVVALHDRFNANVVDAVAWLKTQPFVDPDRIVMSGCSFGGIQTMLTAEKGLGIRAFVPFAPAAMSWGMKPLQERLEKAARNAKSPVFLLQAKNDFNTGPSEVLGPILAKLGPPSGNKLYPPFGKTPERGHASFACWSLGTSVWGADVLKFIDAAFNVSAAEDAESFNVPADPVAVELVKLMAEYDRLNKLRQEAYKATAEGLGDGGKPADEKLSDKEWLEQGRKIDAKAVDPDVAMLPRFLELAKSHPDSPYAFDALFFVISRGGPQTGDVFGKPWQLKEEAIDLIWKSHAKDPRLFTILEQLGGALPSDKTQALLKRAMDEGPDKSVRAAGAYNLASYYATLAHAARKSQQIDQKQHPLNFERFWKLVVTPYLEKHFPLDEERNSAEIDRLLRLVTDKYADVPVSNWELSGPGKTFLELTPYPKPKTYGDLARTMSFALSNVVPGKPAPEIKGTDAEGKTFRLSDYKGKAVLLIFSANWCGGCVELHPMERKLVEKYRDRPFVVLGVSRDVKVDTLKADTASGEITWRCWWDGMYGPIGERWNIDGIPRLILLDNKHTFHNIAIGRYTTQEELEQTIDGLLKKAQANNTTTP
jgi:dienelactone hydrolase/thiol-disulfide isomerase/thioredoxin